MNGRFIHLVREISIRKFITKRESERHREGFICENFLEDHNTLPLRRKISLYSMVMD